MVLVSCGTVSEGTIPLSEKAISDFGNQAVDAIIQPDTYMLVPCSPPPESKSDATGDAMELMASYLNGPALDCFHRVESWQLWYNTIYKPTLKQPEQ